MDDRSFGDRMADAVAAFVGSWRFIIIQTVVMAFWVIYNTWVVATFIELHTFDAFPFIFLNLFMSAEAAYSTPIIMMSQNRAAERDRAAARDDLETDHESLRQLGEIKSILEELRTR